MGIRAMLNGFAQALARVDPQVAAHLDNSGVKPQFYAFRWITLLLTQVCTTYDVLIACITLVHSTGVCLSRAVSAVGHAAQ